MHLQTKILFGKGPSACEMQTNILLHLGPLPNKRNGTYDVGHEIERMILGKKKKKEEKHTEENSETREREREQPKLRNKEYRERKARKKGDIKQITVSSSQD